MELQHNKGPVKLITIKPTAKTSYPHLICTVGTQKVTSALSTHSEPKTTHVQHFKLVHVARMLFKAELTPCLHEH